MSSSNSAGTAPSNVMDELREEARKRGEQRVQRELEMQELQKQFQDMNRHRAPASSSSDNKAPHVDPSAGSTQAAASPFVDDILIDEAPVLCGCGLGNQGSIAEDLLALAGLKAPPEASFYPEFKQWFEEDYFPAMSNKLQKELVSRARSKGFFSGLSSQVKKTLMANTDARLQAEVWHAYFAQHHPPTFETYGCIRVATVNLGSVDQPCLTKFVGYQSKGLNHWTISPFASADPNISSVLDELDSRGGMAALLAAA
mmetsp:Transcript_96077/g.200712  ORF Transcript_96077/g.200712 Transcript_96077/m.200712 type:complete len:257 (+) Transcript_96077:53-823(+)|eukprot:CAMPEP_0206419584 /NCGR_PEP_ID=MMETSP0324_2-20121206/234_1 /ASSEMBLY_ACC=CAM_ASM_000836 /TAXON_ID=2866 /ORGANISM="Crypthecodinium cohnii, Strain Seligo" /LENGTH=256 /DNA_ID=CAMNT_0053883105 /DNA_START=31 /DNA_END=801 /DNA_ORIENTATION=+